MPSILQYRTSLKGLSKLRTQYKNLPIKDKFCSPKWYCANTFLSLKEESLYITAKMAQKWLVPKYPL